MTTQTERGTCIGQGLVHVEHLTKHYRKTPALRDYSLSLDSGHIVGLMGPNGCGKTTLLKILAGVLNDYQGQVSIDGHKPGIDTKAIVSYLPSAAFLNGEWTVERAINIYSRFFTDFEPERARTMVVLDEPISGVDPATRDIILEGILREFDPESLLVMSTHLISDIEHFVDYALFMKEGQVLLQGDADDLRATRGDSLDAIFRKEYR